LAALRGGLNFQVSPPKTNARKQNASGGLLPIVQTAALELRGEVLDVGEQKETSVYGHAMLRSRGRTGASHGTVNEG
jgi:hypothetical protein